MIKQKNAIIKVRGLAIKDGKVLLCRLSKEWFYCLPGGTIENDELLIDGLKREFVEELGIDPKVWEIVHVNDFKDERGLVVDVWYDILNLDEYENIDLSKTTHWFELSEVGYYDLDEIEWMYAPSYLKDFIK